MIIGCRWVGGIFLFASHACNAKIKVKTIYVFAGLTGTSKVDALNIFQLDCPSKQYNDKYEICMNEHSRLLSLKIISVSENGKSGYIDKINLVHW